MIIAFTLRDGCGNMGKSPCTNIDNVSEQKEVLAFLMLGSA